MITKYEELTLIDALPMAGFNLFSRAIHEAGLADAVEAAENITIFAPCDEAFWDMGDMDFDELLYPANRKKLIKILKYHMISSTMTADLVVSVDDIEMMNGKKVEIFMRNGAVLVNDAEVIEPDIQAENGIIHKIDKVLIPE